MTERPPARRAFRFRDRTRAAAAFLSARHPRHRVPGPRAGSCRG